MANRYVFLGDSHTCGLEIEDHEVLDNEFELVNVMKEGLIEQYDFKTAAVMWHMHMAQQTNTITTNLCESVKASGVLIFAVTFQVTDTNTKTMMENCASQPAYYFDSPSNAELRNSFKQIGNILSSLRISK